MASQKSTILFALVLVGLIVLILVLGMSKENSVSEEIDVKVVTDKEEYVGGKDILKVKIENISQERICFSSCIPFYLKKKDDGYKGFDYNECSREDIAEKCIDPAEVKAFAIDLPSEVRGEYLLAIPACVGCNIRQIFREDQKIYSNEFVIK